MRFLRSSLCAGLALAGYTPLLADSTVDYNSGSGWTSNIFQDTTALSAGFGETGVGLRGSLDLDGAQFAYGLTASARRVPRYRFADRQTAGAELGYSRDLGEGVRFTLKGALQYRRDGDIFLAVPGLTIGYRKADLSAATSAGIAAEHWGGKSHLTVSLSNLEKGRAHFTLRGLAHTQLEAGNTLYEISGGHIRALFGGEVGATVQYRTNHIDGGEQKAFGRFPAQTLRGSLAYGRAFANGLTLMVEAGIVGVDSRHLGKTVERVRPFMKGEASWKGPHDIVLKATGGRDIQLADIDDALGEDFWTAGLSLEKALSERLKIGLAYEQAYSDWLYYDYRTRTKTAKVTLSYALAKATTASVEYSRLIRRETDKAAEFEADGLALRLGGSF